MTLKADKVKTYLSLKSKEYEMLRIRADELALPDNLPRLVENWRDSAESLPNELPQKAYILKLLGAAEYALERNDERDFRLWILKAMMNFDNAKHDLVLYKREQGAIRGGKALKRKPWAERLAEALAELGLSFPKAWATIPEDENQPLALDEDTGIYRSDGGEKLVAVDLVTEGELGAMSRSNFKKRYFAPAKQNRDSN